VILVFAVAIGIVVAVARGGDLHRLVGLRLRFGWLALLALAAQVYVIYYPAEQVEGARTLHAAVMMGSYAALVVLVLVNRGIPGMPVIGLGLLLNLAVMASNGGYMPVTREAIIATGTRSEAELPPDGARLPRSKDVLLPADQTRLWILSDVITAPRMPLARIYSIGDLVVATGVVLLIQVAMVPGRYERSLETGL